MNKSSNTEVNQPVEMTPFVINYYGRLGRRRLHFVNLIMPAATQWLDPFPWSMDSPLLYMSGREWKQIGCHLSQMLLIMCCLCYFDVCLVSQDHIGLYTSWACVHELESSRVVARKRCCNYYYTLPRGKRSYHCILMCVEPTYILDMMFVIDLGRFWVSLGSDKLVHSPVALSCTHFSMFSHATKA